MPYKSFTSAALCALLFSSVNLTETLAAPGVSTKKGVGTWAFPGSKKALTDVKAAWFYNWSPTLAGVEAPAGLNFVPMVWGRNHLSPQSLAAVKDVPVLLGFNEPDHDDQSKMTVGEALALWPKLEATGAKRLGSPATANDARASNSWLEQFMAGAKAKGLRVDFICVHRYVDTFEPRAATLALKDFLEGVYKKYGLPLWVTEYALVRWETPTVYATPSQQAAFAQSSAAMMEALPFVERYAWFAAPPASAAPGLTATETVSLYTNGGKATTTGKGYRQAGRIGRSAKGKTRGP